MTNEGEDDSIVLLEQADALQERGESITVFDLKDKYKCKPFLQSLMQALSKREAVLGRYNQETAQTYVSIGNLYSQMNQARAVVMFRTSFRIESFLYGKLNGKVSEPLRLLLERRGLSQADVKEIEKDVIDSMRHEIEGDILRRFGDRRAAALEYQKAAKIEELAFGKDNPDLAYLWRKMACLLSIKKLHLHSIDYEHCDRPGGNWMKQSRENLSTTGCSSIEKGDQYYKNLRYGKAIAEYIKATSSDRQKFQIRQRRRSPKQPEKASLPPLEQELLMMLASGHSMNQSVGGTNKSVQSVGSASIRRKTRRTNISAHNKSPLPKLKASSKASSAAASAGSEDESVIHTRALRGRHPSPGVYISTGKPPLRPSPIITQTEQVQVSESTGVVDASRAQLMEAEGATKLLKVSSAETDSDQMPPMRESAAASVDKSQDMLEEAVILSTTEAMEASAAIASVTISNVTSSEDRWSEMSDDDEREEDELEEIISLGETAEKPSKLNQRPSSHEWDSKRSSRSLVEASSNKPKSESYLKTAVKLASKTTKKLRKKTKGVFKPRSVGSFDPDTLDESDRSSSLVNKSESYLVLLDDMPNSTKDDIGSTTALNIAKASRQSISDDIASIAESEQESSPVTPTLSSPVIPINRDQHMDESEASRVDAMRTSGRSNTKFSNSNLLSKDLESMESLLSSSLSSRKEVITNENDFQGTFDREKVLVGPESVVSDTPPLLLSQGQKPEEHPTAVPFPPKTKPTEFATLEEASSQSGREGSFLVFEDPSFSSPSSHSKDDIKIEKAT